MNHAPTVQVASPETARERIEMLRGHLQILKNLHAAPDVLQVVEQVIKATEQRLADLERTQSQRP